MPRRAFYFRNDCGVTGPSMSTRNRSRTSWNFRAFSSVLQRVYDSSKISTVLQQPLHLTKVAWSCKTSSILHRLHDPTILTQSHTDATILHKPNSPSRHKPTSSSLPPPIRVSIQRPSIMSPPRASNLTAFILLAVFLHLAFPQHVRRQVPIVEPPALTPFITASVGGGAAVYVQPINANNKTYWIGKPTTSLALISSNQTQGPTAVPSTVLQHQGASLVDSILATSPPL